MRNDQMFDAITSAHFGPAASDNMTRNDLVNLMKVVSMVRKPGMQICEIGTNMGYSAALLGMIAREEKGKVVTIDPFNWTTGNEWIQAFHTNMAQFGLTKEHVEHIKAFSYDAAVNFANDFFDVIFIDGDHYYDGIKKDIILYYPKLKSGGIMCGHDCEVRVKDGILDMRTVKTWNNRDIIGIHMGVVVAVEERFKEDFEIHGERIWCHKKQ
jgi:predicted O-methyltransferase YrrM